METPTLRDIEWASVLYTLTSGYDEDYVTYMRKLDGYRPFDEKKQEGDFKPGDVIIEFLHKWHTQGVPSAISGKLTEKIKKNADRIDSLLEVPLHEVSESGSWRHSFPFHEIFLIWLVLLSLTPNSGYYHRLLEKQMLNCCDPYKIPFP